MNSNYRSAIHSVICGRNLVLLLMCCFLAIAFSLPGQSSSSKESESKVEAEKAFGEQLLLKMSEPAAPEKRGTGTTGSKKIILLRGELAHDEVLVQLEQLGLLCAIQQGRPNQLIVLVIKPGSAAYYKGLEEGDAIKDLGQVQGQVFVSFIRNSKLYQLTMPAPGGNLLSEQQVKTFFKQISSEKMNASRTAIKDKGSKEPGALVTEMMVPPTELDAAVNELAKFKIEIVLCSTPDLFNLEPGAKQTPIKWCADQLADLASKLEPHGKTFSLTVLNTFATNQSNRTGEAHVVNCTTESVSRLLHLLSKTADEHLPQSLQTRLDDICKESGNSVKPVLIAILGHGLPHTMKEKQALSRMMTAAAPKEGERKQFYFTFLEFGRGSEFDADSDPSDLTLNLLAKIQPFSHFEQKGLAQALADAAQWRSYNKMSVPDVQHSPAKEVYVDADTGLDLPSKERQRHALEKDLLSY
jgi:hypothetical protein